MLKGFLRALILITIALGGLGVAAVGLQYFLQRRVMSDLSAEAQFAMAPERNGVWLLRWLRRIDRPDICPQVETSTSSFTPTTIKLFIRSAPNVTLRLPAGFIESHKFVFPWVDLDSTKQFGQNLGIWSQGVPSNPRASIMFWVSSDTRMAQGSHALSDLATDYRQCIVHSGFGIVRAATFASKVPMSETRYLFVAYFAVMPEAWLIVSGEASSAHDRDLLLASLETAQPAPSP